MRELKICFIIDTYVLKEVFMERKNNLNPLLN